MRSRWRDGPRDGVDGRDADPVELERMVEDALARFPKPKDGRDADPDEIRRQVYQAVERIRIPVAKDGSPGPRGPQGPEGPEGPPGPKPAHEWKGSELRFEKQDGTWGKFVDLRGPPGAGGGIVQVGTDAPPFDLDSLPIGDDTTPEEIVVKQNGIWVRVTWDQFLAFTAPSDPLPLSLNGDPLSLNGDLLDLS